MSKKTSVALSAIIALNLVAPERLIRQVLPGMPKVKPTSASPNA